jgi:hypothetical protein
LPEGHAQRPGDAEGRRREPAAGGFRAAAAQGSFPSKLCA